MVFLLFYYLSSAERMGSVLSFATALGCVVMFPIERRRAVGGRMEGMQYISSFSISCEWYPGIDGGTREMEDFRFSIPPTENHSPPFVAFSYLQLCLPIVPPSHTFIVQPLDVPYTRFPTPVMASWLTHRQVSSRDRLARADLMSRLPLQAARSWTIQDLRAPAASAWYAGLRHTGCSGCVGGLAGSVEVGDGEGV